MFLNNAVCMTGNETHSFAVVVKLAMKTGATIMAAIKATGITKCFSAERCKLVSLLNFKSSTKYNHKKLILTL